MRSKANGNIQLQKRHMGVRARKEMKMVNVMEERVTVTEGPGNREHCTRPWLNQERKVEEMNTLRNGNKHRHLGTLAYTAGRVCIALAFALSMAGGVVQAAPSAAPLAATSPGLGAAGSFSVLAGSIATNTGASTISGWVGVSPSIGVPPHATGFPVGTTIEDATVTAGLAQAANTAAFGALSQGCDFPAYQFGAGVVDLVGANLVPGVYCADAFALSGTLILSGSGVWIFRSASTLTTSGTANVVGGDPCNVWWQEVSSANLGVNTSLIGNVLASTSIDLATGARLNGRALAQTGAVTLDAASITGPGCAAAASTGGGGASYVSVDYACVDDGSVTVTVGISDFVVVTGLGDAITSPDNNFVIVRSLPAGQYFWHASPAPGHYMVDTADGVVDSTYCGPAAIGAPSATPEGPVLIPNTGADLTLAARLWIPVSLGFLGLGLVLLGFVLKRKQSS